MPVLVGTSGWQYRDWRGRFYPPKLPQRLWLEHHAAAFATTEVNNSFYRLPAAETFAAWRRRVPAGFAMAVKASRYLTHLRRLREPAEPVERFWSRARRLGERLGPVLYQLPPRWRCDPGRLRQFVSLLPADLRHVFEFRDPSWYTPPVLDRLAQSGCALVVPVWGANPAPSDALVAGPFRYLRFHHGAYGTGLTDGELDAWTPRILAEAAGHEVYIYFNNDPDGHAVRDAERLRGMLS